MKHSLMHFKTVARHVTVILMVALLLPLVPQAQYEQMAPANLSLGDILQQAIKASDELNIVGSRIQQARSGISEARANYYPQVTLTERFGRDAAYPSSARTSSDPRGQSEYVNANSTKMEINQMLFDGFKTPAEVERQEQSLEALEQRYRTASQQVVRDTLEVYLTAWRHLQALRAGVALVEDLTRLKKKVDLQAEMGATDMTAKSYVDSRLTGATQQLLKTRNAYREALYRLGFLLQWDMKPETFTFSPLLAPRLQDMDTYLATLKANNPELLEEQANMSASQQELRKAKSPYYPTLSLTSDLQDSNDLGGSVGTVRTGNAMVQVSYKLFDGYAARHGKARVKNQITESEYRIRRTTRRLEEDLSQAWRKAVASEQEATLAGDEATASLKVKQLRAQDVESGSGDIVRLIEAEEALYTAILRQLDLVQGVTAKRYDLAVTSGQLENLACVDGGCPEIPMEPVAYINPVEVEEVKTVTDPVSTTSVVSDTTNLLPEGTTAPVTPPITGTEPVPTEVSATEAPLLAPQPEPQSETQPEPQPEAMAPAQEVSPSWSDLTETPQATVPATEPILNATPQTSVAPEGFTSELTIPNREAQPVLTQPESPAVVPQAESQPSAMAEPAAEVANAIPAAQTSALQVPASTETLPDPDAPRDFEAPPEPAQNP